MVTVKPVPKFPKFPRFTRPGIRRYCAPMSIDPTPVSPDPPFGHRPNGAVADPLDAAHFADFFAARAEPGLKALEGERLAAVAGFKRKAVIGGAIALVAAALLWPFAGQVAIAPVLLFAIYVAVVLYRPLKALGDQAKVRLLTVITDALGFSYQLDGFAPPGFDRLRSMNLLPAPERSSYDDLFSGARSGAAFAMCDAHLEREEGSGKDSHWVTIFRGQLIRLTFPKRFQGVTVIARDAGWFNMLNRPKGLQRVGLGASQFERAFEVYSDDQVEARFLVHPAFMQKLLDMEAAYNGSKLRGMFCEGDLLLAVEGRDRFEFGNPFKPFDDIDKAQAVVADLNQVLGLIDFILAGPPRAPELAPQSSP